MKGIIKVVHGAIGVFKVMGNIVILLMMLLLVFSAFMKKIGYPIIGDYELTELLMLSLIMFALAYTHLIKGHISIGIIVDRLSEKVQVFFDIFANLITMLVTLTIFYYFFNLATERFLSPFSKSTDLLSIPFYPFEYIISIGFLLWGLESGIQIYQIIFIRNNATEMEE